MLLTRVANWKNTFLLQGEKNVVYAWDGCLNSRDSPFLEFNSLASDPKMEEQKQGSAGNPKYADKTDYGTIKNLPLIDQSIIQCQFYHKVPQLQIMNKLKLDSTRVV
jgi:hypothetical protein